MRISLNNPQWVAVILTVLSLLLTGAGYVNKINTRIERVETRQADQDQKIDHIQSQADKLVEWALGHK